MAVALGGGIALGDNELLKKSPKYSLKSEAEPLCREAVRGYELFFKCGKPRYRSLYELWEEGYEKRKFK